MAAPAVGPKSVLRRDKPTGGYVRTLPFFLPACCFSQARAESPPLKPSTIAEPVGHPLGPASNGG